MHLNCQTYCPAEKPRLVIERLRLKTHSTANQETDKMATILVSKNADISSTDFSKRRKKRVSMQLDIVHIYIKAKKSLRTKLVLLLWQHGSEGRIFDIHET